MINFLYTNIGRGHPFYLDGIVELLKPDNGNRIDIKDVFEISRGQSLAAWKMARKLYRVGSTDSIIGKMYNRLRDQSEYNKTSLTMKIMGRDVCNNYLHDETPLVVAHPVLVGMLNGKKNLLYQHGELAVPKQAVVKGADFVFVPSEDCLPPFLNAGYKREQLIVSGLCIEPVLVALAETAFEKRIKRIQSKESLTGAFFSSGAEPKPHLVQIVRAVDSITQNDGKAIVFANNHGHLHKLIQRKFDKTKKSDAITICTFSNREELNELTLKYFNQFDYLVSPAHERTNWALGLGLPIFILEPDIGPFAPLNHQILMKSKVAKLVDSRAAEEFHRTTDQIKASGELVQMAQAGWKKYPIYGFRTIADFLVNKFPLNS